MQQSQNKLLKQNKKERKIWVFQTILKKIRKANKVLSLKMVLLREKLHGRNAKTI